MKSKPPTDLSEAGKKLWRKIAKEIELDAPAVLLLDTLCRAFDRLQQARDILASEGIILTDRFGQKKPHPATAVERDSCAALCRCWRLLGFDLMPPGVDRS